MIKALFFDFDGTIVESRKIHEEAFLETLEKYGIDYEKKQVLHLMGIRLNIIFKTLGIKIRNFERFRKDFYDLLTQKTNHKTIKKATNLAILKKFDVPIFIISNSKTTYLTKAISTLRIAEYFDNVYGEEKFNNKEAMIKRLLKKYKLKPTEAAYLGDSTVDVDVARNVGCKAIVISHEASWSTSKELETKRPDYHIKTLKELGKIISHKT